MVIKNHDQNTGNKRDEGKNDIKCVLGNTHAYYNGSDSEKGLGKLDANSPSHSQLKFLKSNTFVNR